jgi:hypothetical protein
MTSREQYILAMVRLAEAEPPEFHGTETLAERVVQYAGTARPKITLDEVRQVMRTAGYVRGF